MSNRPFQSSTAKIYKIISESNSELGCYIGSTCLDLNKRFEEHKRSYRKFVNRGKPMENSKVLLMFNDVKIVPLEDCSDCKTREEMEEKEYKWIQETPNCLNKFKRRH